MAQQIRAERSEDLRHASAKSVILNFKTYKGTLVYSNNQGETKMLKRDFADIFNSINSKVLAANTDIILPTGCIYRTLLENGKEAFLIQEQPGIRTFRCSQTTSTKDLISKMYNKFVAQTRVLEKNEVTPDDTEKVEKLISLRKQYLSQQKISVDGHDKHYKYFFRVYFPYSYILITIDRNQLTGRLQFSGMHAAISLDPIITMDDYLYQFPLSNVSQGGSVCTGKLPLGDYGHINVKTYVEKMSGYFWNNKFNSDITAGPQAYGDKNFLGNWFEWEFESYVNPASILSLNFNEHDSIKDTRLSVGKFVYNSQNGSSNHGGKTRIHTINEKAFVQGFEPESSFGDATVNIQNGEARKLFNSVAESIEMEGYQIPVGTIIHHKDDMFKIVSYDGYRTYDVDDSTLYEKDVVVTHYQIKKRGGGIYLMKLNEAGGNFLVAGYRKAKNFVAEATFGDVTFKSGTLLAYRSDGAFDSDVNISYDMIKSIRENDRGYIMEFFGSLDDMRIRKDETPENLRNVEIRFDAAYDKFSVQAGQEFNYRSCKVLKNSQTPMPYTINEHLSSLNKASVTLGGIVYKQDIRPSHYSYHNRRNRDKEFFVDYTVHKNGFDDEEYSTRVNICGSEIRDGQPYLFVTLPDYMQISAEEFEEVVPQVLNETAIVGEKVYQAISSCDEPEEVPFKIMRDSNGLSKISTIRDKRSASENMFFKPSLDHLKACLSEIDGVLTFKVRDLLECGTENEYIEFKVGDEVLLASDWNPKSKAAPSIKKIYDFMTLEDRSEKNVLIIGPGMTVDVITAGTMAPTADMLDRRYKKYVEPIESLNDDEKDDPLTHGIKAPKGTLYAVVKGDDDEMILHPMIDSAGQHYLNGITHVKKEIGDMKAGDFIKADVGKIPYFTKKTVDEIVCFININGRELTILRSGYTMWHDVVEKGFKVFHRDKLTDAKVDFYAQRVREPYMEDFMVLYGDQYLGQVGVPIMIRDVDHKEDGESLEDYRQSLYGEAYANGWHTTHINRRTYESLKRSNGNSEFETFAQFNHLTKMLVRLDPACGSFRVMYDTNTRLGDTGDHGSDGEHIGSIGLKDRFYDICYSMQNRSLTNGAAYMPMYDCFVRPMLTYTYYSSPYKMRHSWLSVEHVKMTMLTFPTPRMLKKSTRTKRSYHIYKLMGPQNRFYNCQSGSDATTKKLGFNSDERIYNITSDDFLPEMEE